MRLGFDDIEYERVRDWLLSALFVSPNVISEPELMDRLSSGEWHLITTENSASVIQLCDINGERICNILVVGGKRNGSLRELMRAFNVLCSGLKENKYTKITGTPRKEWHRFLINHHGFQKEKGGEFLKEL